MLRSAKYIFCSLSLVLCVNAAFPQQPKIDSIRSLLVTMKPDTAKVRCMNELTLQLDIMGAFDSAISSATRSRSLAGQLNYAPGEAVALGDLGIVNYEMGNFTASLDLNNKALELYRRLNDKNGIQKTLANLGIVCIRQSDYTNALSYCYQALRVAEERDHKPGIAAIMGNIGIVYMSQASLANSPDDKDALLDKALTFYTRAIQVQEEMHDTISTLNNLSNIAGVYCEKAVTTKDTSASRKDFSKALDAGMKALRIARAIDNPYPSATVLGNIGSLYLQMAGVIADETIKTRLYAKSVGYLEEALEKVEMMGLKNAVAHDLGALGEAYFRTGKYEIAKGYLSRGVALSDSIGELDVTRMCEQTFYQMEAAHGNYESAFVHYQNYIAARDSISNDANIKKQTQIEMQYDFDKKETLAKDEQDKKDAITRIVIWSISAGLFLVLILAIFIFRGYRQKQKANIIITQQRDEVERQKELVEEKQKEILDSIHYARRIQRSLLPTTRYIEKQLDRLKKK